MSIGAKLVPKNANALIFQDEFQAINKRRRALNKKREEQGEPLRPELPLRQSYEYTGEVIETIGLALSGSGLRSVAVCLGALQAPNHNNALRNVVRLDDAACGRRGQSRHLDCRRSAAVIDLGRLSLPLLLGHH
jgi:hypothetical protein